MSIEYEYNARYCFDSDGGYQMTSEKVALLRKIVDAQLTKEEMRSLIDYGEMLVKSRNTADNTIYYKQEVE